MVSPGHRPGNVDWHTITALSGAAAAPTATTPTSSILKTHIGIMNRNRNHRSNNNNTSTRASTTTSLTTTSAAAAATPSLA